MIKKRIAFIKYNLLLKKQMNYSDPIKEEKMLFYQNRSINLFNFSNNYEFLLLKEHSDSSEFGGESQCKISKAVLETGESVCNLKYLILL